MSKAAEAFRTISEVAAELAVPKHVLRFWEAKFPQIRPMKRGGGRRYYRPSDMELLRGIRHLLHAEGYTIKGVQKILREQGIDAVKHYAEATAEAAESKGRRSVRQLREIAGDQPRAANARRIDAAGEGLSGAALVNRMIVELEACRRILLSTTERAAETESAPAARRRSARS